MTSPVVICDVAGMCVHKTRDSLLCLRIFEKWSRITENNYIYLSKFEKNYLRMLENLGPGRGQCCYESRQASF